MANCSTKKLYGTSTETLGLVFDWPDEFTGLTCVFKVGTKGDFSEVAEASLTIDVGDATQATGDLLLDMGTGCYYTQLHMTDGSGNITIVEGPELIVKPNIA